MVMALVVVHHLAMLLVVFALKVGECLPVMLEKRLPFIMLIAVVVPTNTLLSVLPSIYPSPAISTMAQSAVRDYSAAGGPLVGVITAACTASTWVRAVSTQPAATVATAVTL